jgi:hypothetical protein
MTREVGSPSLMLAAWAAAGLLFCRRSTYAELGDVSTGWRRIRYLRAAYGRCRFFTAGCRLLSRRPE